MQDVFFIDHYDSFSYNLIDWLGAADPTIRIQVVTKDDSKSLKNLQLHPAPLVLSPGPGSPQDEHSTIELAATLLGKVPILGVCLGHQILGLLAGGEVTRSVSPMHGDTRLLRVLGESKLLAGAPENMKMAAYNSLRIVRLQKANWAVTAMCSDGDIQAIEYTGCPWLTAGVQFHPESHLSVASEFIAKNWLTSVAKWKA